ncbi:SIS domain-containing protein [Vibrio sp. SCSIO 43137]|uniref:SIS domain-containing protein n=1 Tax=Vibrio sp. SCSIO 43137 TaxID=3021011 RepID=UPI002306E82C|nr:SIS domain-containing protein [Vibrio sp. SCSIO 43137]WCE29866.1 SIS domain-containing protein [Vibrio sp. SCSIO 43137]
MEIKDFTLKYVNDLKAHLDAIDTEVVAQIVDEIEKVSKTGSTFYVIGNGGSSATASHWANDFAIGLKRRGILAIDMVSLGDNAAVTSAIANDIGYENIFYMQLKDVLKPEDVILAISCSGNSPNIVTAVEYAKQIGSTVIGASGFDGGKLKQLSDIEFHVDTEKDEYGLVEDIHMILDHIIYSYYIQKASK